MLVHELVVLIGAADQRDVPGSGLKGGVIEAVGPVAGGFQYVLEFLEGSGDLMDFLCGKGAGDQECGEKELGFHSYFVLMGFSLLSRTWKKIGNWTVTRAGLPSE